MSRTFGLSLVGSDVQAVRKRLADLPPLVTVALAHAARIPRLLSWALYYDCPPSPTPKGSSEDCSVDALDHIVSSETVPDAAGSSPPTPLAAGGIAMRSDCSCSDGEADHATCCELGGADAEADCDSVAASDEVAMQLSEASRPPSAVKAAAAKIDAAAKNHAAVARSSSARRLFPDGTSPSERTRFTRGTSIPQQSASSDHAEDQSEIRPASQQHTPKQSSETVRVCTPFI